MELSKNEVLVLRCCNEDLTSYGGFKYPEKGYVEAPDWKNDKKDAGGLHGLLWGTSTEDYEIDGVVYHEWNPKYDITQHGKMWQLIKVDKTKGIVDFDRYIKFRCGEVLISSLNQVEVIDLLMQNVPDELKNRVYYQTQIGNKFAIQNARHHAYQLAGFYAKQDAGIASIQIGEWSATQNAESKAVQISGSLALQRSCHYSSQITRDSSIQITGAESLQIAGVGCVSIVNGLECTYRGGKGSILIVTDRTLRHVIETQAHIGNTLYITRGEIEKIYTTTPDNLIELEEHEIFVFFTDLSGSHNTAAGTIAVEKFGAVVGQSVGVQGQSYAIPIVDKNMQPLSKNEIAKYVDDFITVACKYTRGIFYLNQPDKELKNSYDIDLRGIFDKTPANVIKPSGWIK